MDFAKRTKQQINSFNVLRGIAIAALICTIALVLFLCGEALTPGDDSSTQSGDVMNFIKDNVDVKDNDTYVPLASIRCNQQDGSTYIGKQVKLTFVFTPNSASNKKLTYSSSNPDIISVDENGILTPHAKGEVTITVTSQDNPNVTTEFFYQCLGKEANDIEDLYPSFEPNEEIVPEENAKWSIPAGTYGDIALRDDTGHIVAINTINVTCHNPDVLYQNHLQLFVALKPGVATLTLTSKKTGYSRDIEITVLPNEEFVPAYTYSFIEDVVTIHVGDKFLPETNVSGALAKDGITIANASANYYAISVENSALFNRSNDTYYANSPGETFFDIKSLAYGTITKFKVVILEKIPTTLNIEGNNRIVSGDTYYYRAFDGQNYATLVKWSVIKGDASIDENGTLRANKLGSITIRVTSLQDESVYKDLTIRVSLFDDFHTFVRKIIGHFSAFALLGFGFAFVYFFLLRPRFIFAPLAVISGFLVAGLTEIFQMPIFTANRGPSLVDVMTDTAGVAFGVAIASAIIFILSLSLKFFNKPAYERANRSLKILKGKTLLLSGKITKMLFDMNEFDR